MARRPSTSPTPSRRRCRSTWRVRGRRRRGRRCRTRCWQAAALVGCCAVASPPSAATGLSTAPPSAGHRGTSRALTCWDAVTVDAVRGHLDDLDGKATCAESVAVPIGAAPAQGKLGHERSQDRVLTVTVAPGRFWYDEYGGYHTYTCSAASGRDRQPPPGRSPRPSVRSGAREGTAPRGAGSRVGRAQGRRLALPLPDLTRARPNRRRLSLVAAVVRAWPKSRTSVG